MISEKIFELILKNGMTQKEFSEETGISQSTISDWKRKGTNPSADKILKICGYLYLSQKHGRFRLQIQEFQKTVPYLARHISFP